jgi:nucleoside 2-deoxyribosyltransferase
MNNVKLAPCPLWGGGQEFPTHGDYSEIENARAGGRYRIARSARGTLERSYSPLLAAKLTTWIIDRHRLGEESPMISSNTFDEINAKTPISFSQQQHRFFLFLIHQNFRAGNSLKFYGDEDGEYVRDRGLLAAWTECDGDVALNGLVHLMEKDNLVELKSGRLLLVPEGFRKLALTQTSSRDSVQAFIAMWFDSTMQDVCEQGFEKAIVAAGYKPMRIDKKEHNNRIDDEIVAEIRRSKFVVADFTCGSIEANGTTQAIARGGVHFEAGYAMGLGIPVIWTCRRDMIENVHFDTRQFSHVVWESPDELKVGLYNRICATIGEMPGALGLR